MGVGGVGAGGLNEDLNGDLSGGADGAEELELSSFERDRTGFESALSPPIVQVRKRYVWLCLYVSMSLYLCIVVISVSIEWCIRKPLTPFITTCNITSITNSQPLY